MRRHEAWRLQYRSRRYLEHLSADELHERARDMLAAYLELTRDGKIAPSTLTDGGVEWLVLLTHLFEEFVIRYGPYPRGFRDGFLKNAQIPDPRSPIAGPAARLVRNVAEPTGAYLVKYGKRQHLQPMLEHGRVRVAGAASYADPSLNPAMMDDELSLFIQPSPAEFRMDVVDGRTGEYKGRIIPLDNRITRRSRSNFYVFCLSRRLAARLFVDFEADACLVIHEPTRFVNALMNEIEGLLSDWSGGAESVRYIDPTNATIHDLDVCSAKHFRFAYQREYRVIWLPPSPVDALPPLHIEIGDLSSYCSLHALDGEGTVGVSKGVLPSSRYIPSDLQKS